MARYCLWIKWPKLCKILAYDIYCSENTAKGDIVIGNIAQRQGVREHKEEGGQLVFRSMDATFDTWYFIRSTGLSEQFFSKAVGQ